MGTINRKYKDRLFCLIFGKEEYKDNLLSLYNALNGTSYDDPGVLEINTLDDAIYMKMKNDVSCIVSSRMPLFEQQSTYNPNMPFREFEYCAKLYDKYIVKYGIDIYSKTPIKIPAPQCYVFYNGVDEHDDKEILKLSDLFEEPVEGYEWTSIMLNINAGHNEELLGKCQALEEYAALVARIRQNQQDGMELEKAVDDAVNMVISREGMLAELLRSHRAEVVDVCITEYDEKLHEMSLIRNERLSQIGIMIEAGYSKEEILRLRYTEAEYQDALSMASVG